MHINEELFQREDFKRNLKAYEEAMKTGKTVFMDIDDMTDIIDFYNYDGRIDDANAMADYALSLYPGAIGPHVFKARQAIANDNIDEAKAQCEAIDDKSDIDYFYLRTELEIAQMNYEESEKMIKEAFKTIEDREDKENFLLDIGALYVDYNAIDLGEKWLDKMEDKENKERLELISRILCNRSEYDEAAKILETLIDKNPFIYRYWNTLGIIHLCRNDFDECRNCAEYSLAIYPNNTDGLWCLAKALVGQGDMEGATETFEKFLKRMPNCAKAELEIGTCLVQLDKADEAEKYLNMALEHNDDDPMVIAQASDDLAFIYSSRGDIDKALQHLDKSEMFSPYIDDSPYTQAQRYVLRGHIYMMNDQPEEGLKYFEKATKKSNRNPEIIFKIMVSLFDHELYDMVLTYYRKLIRVIPEGWDVGYAYAAASYFKTKDIDKGTKCLKKACQLNPKEVETIFGNFFPSGMNNEEFCEMIKNLKLK